MKSFKQFIAVPPTEEQQEENTAPDRTMLTVQQDNLKRAVLRNKQQKLRMKQQKLQADIQKTATDINKVGR